MYQSTGRGIFVHGLVVGIYNCTYSWCCPVSLIKTLGQFQGFINQSAIFWWKTWGWIIRFLILSPVLCLTTQTLGLLALFNSRMSDQFGTLAMSEGSLLSSMDALFRQQMDTYFWGSSAANYCILRIMYYIPTILFDKRTKAQRGAETGVESQI